MRKFILTHIVALTAVFSTYGMFYFHTARQYVCEPRTETKSGAVDGKFTTLDATISRDFMGRCTLSIINTHGLRVERTFAMGRPKPQKGWVLISQEAESPSSHEKRPR